MFLKSLKVMFLWLFFLGKVITLPDGDEYQSIFKDGETITSSNGINIKFIVPGYISHTPQRQTTLQIEDFIDKDNEHFKILNHHIEAGHTMKGLTFTIYDDNMREAAVALFRLMKNVETNKIEIVKDWAHKHINKYIVEYALNLLLIHKDDIFDIQLDPPFITNPYFFVNSETIHKALNLKLDDGKIDPEEGQIYQIFKYKDLFIINSNYSGWNNWNEDCKDNLDYFRQDIGLNSYYYGLHLQYPFWMSNDELSAVNPEYTEQYYYDHKNLIARYNLEKEHLRQRNISTESKCYEDFVPYLSYENGMPFPARSSTVQMEFNEEYARIKSIDLAIKEFISRGVIFLENRTKVYLTEENYVDLLTKLIRANYESIQTAKSIRDLVGYGDNVQSSESYNSSPSVLHQPETTLRDPIYWYMLQNVLNYYTEYTNTLEPYDFSKYQSKDIRIIDNSFSKIVTYYDYFYISLNNIFENDDLRNAKFKYTARQKRIKHLPFNLTFHVYSKVNKTSLVKLFIGPMCQGVSCWEKFSQFYELDIFAETLEEGLNLIQWAPELGKYSIDDYYNTILKTSRSNKFDLVKFPENLIIPKGLNEGLNITLFILIVPVDGDFEAYYCKQPINFPFHRKVAINDTDFSNYKFYNISVYHKENTREEAGYFSPHLN